LFEGRFVRAKKKKTLQLDTELARMCVFSSLPKRFFLKPNICKNVSEATPFFFFLRFGWGGQAPPRLELHRWHRWQVKHCPITTATTTAATATLPSAPRFRTHPQKSHLRAATRAVCFPSGPVLLLWRCRFPLTCLHQGVPGSIQQLSALQKIQVQGGGWGCCGTEKSALKK